MQQALIQPMPVPCDQNLTGLDYRLCCDMAHDSLDSSSKDQSCISIEDITLYNICLGKQVQCIDAEIGRLSVAAPRYMIIIIV